MSTTLNPDELRRLRPHKLAALFPMLEGDDFAALRADIKAAGKVREPIYLCGGSILDGRNRVRAAIDLGNIHVEAIDVGTLTEDEARALVISLNLHRRHLTREQRREIVADLLKAKPEASNVTIAQQAKVDDKTVAKVRARLESTSEIPRLAKTVGRDGKARSAMRTPPATDKATKHPVVVTQEHWDALEARAAQEKAARAARPAKAAS